MAEVEVLPPGARLFHVGPQKTGTTALQAAAAANREALAEHGVVYPGTTVNHRLAVAALVGKKLGWKDADATGGVPARAHWDRLVAEVRAHPAERAWFGHEYGAGATTDAIEVAQDAFGDDLYVLVTLRSFSRLLPSVWQETTKAAGNRGTFDRWLTQAFTEGTRVNRILRTRHDQPALLRRWADVLGDDRVIVVVPDPDDHDVLHHAVEDLLGLPRDLLARVERAPHATNRSLTVPEIELFRQFNKRFRAEATTWTQYDTLIVRGAIARVLGYRRPGPDEPRLALPDWAADAADALSASNAAGVAASGVRIIGDPRLLALPAKRRSGAGGSPSAGSGKADPQDHRTVESVPVDLAAEAMLGLAASALGLTPGFQDPQEAPAGVNPLSRYTARELGRELYRRGLARVRG